MEPRMNELERLDKAADLADRIIDQLHFDEVRMEFSVMTDALAAVVVMLFLHHDFGELSRERALTIFLQTMVRDLIVAIDRREDQPNRMN
jgi:hypothetical protein